MRSNIYTCEVCRKEKLRDGKEKDYTFSEAAKAYWASMFGEHAKSELTPKIICPVCVRQIDENPEAVIGRCVMDMLGLGRGEEEGGDERPSNETSSR